MGMGVDSLANPLIIIMPSLASALTRYLAVSMPYTEQFLAPTMDMAFLSEETSFP